MRAISLPLFLLQCRSKSRSVSRILWELVFLDRSPSVRLPRASLRRHPTVKTDDIRCLSLGSNVHISRFFSPFFQEKAKNNREQVKLLLQVADSFVEKGHAHAPSIKQWVTEVDDACKDFSTRMDEYRLVERVHICAENLAAVLSSPRGIMQRTRLKKSRFETSNIVSLPRLTG